MLNLKYLSVKRFNCLTCKNTKSTRGMSDDMRENAGKISLELRTNLLLHLYSHSSPSSQTTSVNAQENRLTWTGRIISRHRTTDSLRKKASKIVYRLHTNSSKTTSVHLVQCRFGCTAPGISNAGSPSLWAPSLNCNLGEILMSSCKLCNPDRRSYLACGRRPCQRRGIGRTWF